MLYKYPALESDLAAIPTSHLRNHKVSALLALEAYCLFRGVY